MSASATNLTPPIRSIAAEASSSLPFNDLSTIKILMNSKASEQKLRERSSSFSSSSSSTDSTISFPGERHNDDDTLSNEDDDSEWMQLERQLQSIRRLMPRDSLSSDDIPLEVLPLAECQVCLEESRIRPLTCCSSHVCPTCIHSHLSTNISQAQIRISCPSCPHIFTREKILSLLSEKEGLNGEIAERYKRFYADINREPHIKTCPQCCAIKEIDKKLFEGIRWKKNIPRRVNCNECHFEWCFYCHSPWHEKMTCKEYQEGEKMLRSWAAEKNNNQQNAQQCPRCKVFISRNGGCPHMICSKCHCDFCYNCGKRRFGIKFLGSHESRFSPFGCKYNLYPDKPILRHTVRGLVAGAATLAAPVAAVGAVALLAVGTTIGAPTYGTYRLVKHIRNKRRARRLRRHSIQSDAINNTNTNNGDDDDDITLAIQASLETYREETEKRDESGKIHTDDSDDDRF